MGQAVTRIWLSRSEARKETSVLHLPPETITDILLRLLAKSVLRCRAVCKEWRFITTDPRFLARRPAEVIMYSYLEVAPWTDRLASHATFDIAVDTLHITADEADQRRRLIRYPKTYPKAGSCLLLSSCNGVLLFKRKDEGSYILCNPATRKWAELPFLHGHVREYAFYLHQSTCEYRLLCNRGWHLVSDAWYILATGAAEPQKVNMHQHAEAARMLTNRSLTAATPVDFYGRLHWPPRRNSNTDETTKMLVLETSSETFHVMARPPKTREATVKLFCKDGLLAAADFEVNNDIKLWFLEDYAVGRWECRYQVATPWKEPLQTLVTAAADSEGNVMLGNAQCLVVHNVRTKATRTVKPATTATQRNNVIMSRYVFRENLVSHRHFGVRSYADLQLIHSWC